MQFRLYVDDIYIYIRLIYIIIGLYPSVWGLKSHGTLNCILQTTHGYRPLSLVVNLAWMIQSSMTSPSGFNMFWFCALSMFFQYMAMDQYLHIPFWGGWTSINPSYFGVHIRYQGFDPSPYVYHCLSTSECSGLKAHTIIRWLANLHWWNRVTWYPDAPLPRREGAPKHGTPFVAVVKKCRGLQGGSWYLWQTI